MTGLLVEKSRLTRIQAALPVLLGLGILQATLADRAEAACTPAKPDWQCLEKVVILGKPVAPTPTKMDGTRSLGQGLCGAFKQCSNPTVSFATRGAGWPGDANVFPEKVNLFMDQRFASGSDGARFDETLQKPFDLTNDVATVGDDASGDFNGPSCSALGYGCPFPGSQKGNALQCFGSRFRGFINILPEWVGQPIHFGVFADNAVSLSLFSVPPPPKMPRPLEEHLLISHALDFNPKLRVTNTITFTTAGLYPIEINHVNFNAAAILEVVVLFNYPSFRDLDQTNNLMAGQSKMSVAVTGQGPDNDRAAFAFGVLGEPVTTPDNFYQTNSGAPAYIDAAKCQQCPRNYADVMGQTPANTGCEPSYYCNAAALCAPCNGDNFCGKTCSPCGGGTPYCVPVGTDDAVCVQCRDTPDCPTGQVCLSNVCTTPNLCCPDRPFLIEPDMNRPGIKACSPCRNHDDCGGTLKCDRLNARCIEAIPEHNTDESCGKNSTNCKNVEGNRPYCLNGDVCVECRNDLECAAGKYCRSGDCLPCLADRKCGKRCGSCGRELTLGTDGVSAEPKVTDTPFCYSPDDTVEKASCVRCVKDSDCGTGGTCDKALHECVNKCTASCPEGQFCDGNRCVQCYTNSQCPCGQCDISTGTCTGICTNNDDCAGNQCCTTNSEGARKCQPGRCAGVAGGALCGCSITNPAPANITNNTIHEPGTDLTHSRGILLATVAALLCALALRRRLPV